jgi:hypothetical protein
MAIVLMTPLGCSTFPKNEAADWILVSSDPTSSILRIHVGFGGCSSFLRTDVEETASTVRINAVVRTSGGDCKAILNVKDIEVKLQAPLGSRKVLGECEGPEGTICYSIKASANPIG